MKYKVIQVEKYRQMKLRKELHIRIKTLAAKAGLTANDYLDKLTNKDDEMASTKIKQVP